DAFQRQVAAFEGEQSLRSAPGCVPDEQRPIAAAGAEDQIATGHHGDGRLEQRPIVADLDDGRAPLWRRSAGIRERTKTIRTGRRHPADVDRLCPARRFGELRQRPLKLLAETSDLGGVGGLVEHLHFRQGRLDLFLRLLLLLDDEVFGWPYPRPL